VVNRTLDFQRIVTLSPQAILLGKMIGEPAISYFLALASLPLAALCWGLGAASGPVIFWLYVNLATFTFMWAALGLINSLSPPAQGAAKHRSGAAGWAIAVFIILPQMLVQGSALRDAAGLGEALAMLTPIVSLMHLWTDNAWNARVAFWGISLPSLILAPLVQLAVAAWIVTAMARRLKNPNDPAVTKRRSYIAVAALDMLVASICYAKWKQGYDATHVVYGYCLAHLGIGVIMMFAVVPRRAAVLSWLWRRDRRDSRLRQLLWADRAPVTVAAVVYGLIGVAILAAGLVLPMQLAAAPIDSTIKPERLAEAAVATTIIVAAVGITHQFFAATAARGGNLLYVLLMVMANVLPPVTAAILSASEAGVAEQRIESLASASAVAFFVMNMSKIASPYVGAGWVIGAYAALGLLCYSLLQRLLQREAATVERKLHGMGVAI